MRIIAATNRDLEAMMRAGSFREDLYYRLQVIELHVPPLRERREEIPQLIEFFLVKYSERYGRPLRRPSEALRETLLNYPWPGNVRELENVIKRFVILQDEGLVLAELKRARSQRRADAPAASRCRRGPAAAAGAARAACRRRAAALAAGRAAPSRRRRAAIGTRRAAPKPSREPASRAARSACPSSRAKPRCAPSAPRFSRRSIASAGTAARPPTILA